MKKKSNIIKNFVLLLSCVLIFAITTQPTFAFFITESNTVVNTFQSPIDSDDEPDIPSDDKPDTPPGEETKPPSEEEPDVPTEEVPDDEGDYTGPIAPPTGDIY